MSTTAPTIANEITSSRSSVSRATVTNVLNKTPHQKIAEPTRQRVLEAAERLGYSPSAAARALRNGGRSDIVLCLLPDWPLGPMVGALSESLSIALAADGLTLLAHTTATYEQPISALWKAITPAAVIAFESFDAKEAAAMRAAGVALAVGLHGGRGQGRGEFGIPEERRGRVQAPTRTGSPPRSPPTPAPAGSPRPPAARLPRAAGLH